MKVANTSFGNALYIKIRDSEDVQLSWREIYDHFIECYPDMWAVQFFPPQDRLVDDANVYHLYVLDNPPRGVDISYE